MVMKLFFGALIGFFLATPLIIIWGWVRWWRSKSKRAIFSIFSLVGLVFASSSALLGVGLSFYGHTVGGFEYYDPKLMRIYFWGTLLSLAGLLFALAGLWKANPLRWHAVVCALGTLTYWLALASSE